ncbi:hypothetical protein BDY21DRAFT_323020 [Lineolata rhizophorae]|uniref:Signal recognition particle subunit SRP72 n=1 Tax=Lineolata rhizophorae TaxID=578093 RepID=A0A6A6NYF6_9PEZI|nr:hypothetical protein BDY21DRAFT_323020 [Lineolata rhizophorae]
MGAATPSLAALLGQATLEDHDAVLKASNAALKKSKSDANALHAKVVALLKLDRFDDALQMFEEAGDELKDRAHLEHAYTLYKAGKPGRAVTVAEAGKEIGERGRGLKHVEAQARYRSEAFPEAADVYDHLLSDRAEAFGEQNDLRINASAVDAQLAWANAGHLARRTKPGREDMDAFETAYNAACGCIARGAFGQGEVLLRRARVLCEALDDLTDAEKAAELLPILIQQIYVMARQGRLDEADELSVQLEVAAIPDASTKHIARVNSLASAKTISNPYLFHRLFHSSPSYPPNDQPFSFQQNLLSQNAATLDMLVFKFSGIAASRQKAPALSVIRAVAYAKGQIDPKAALRAIVPVLEKHPEDIGLACTAAHLALQTNNYSGAVRVLERMDERLNFMPYASQVDVQDLRYSPGLVALMTTLYNVENRSVAAKKVLLNAARHWRQRQHDTSSQIEPSALTAPDSLFHAAGIALLDAGGQEDLAEAAKLFGALRDVGPEDQAARAGFVAAQTAAHIEMPDADWLDGLTPVPSLVQSVDVDILEEAGVPRVGGGFGTEQGGPGRKRAGPSNETRRKKRKLRQSRMPKNFEPEKKVDPERWLPMKERSYYKPKGKKGKGRAGGDRTQGGFAAEDGAKRAASGGGVPASAGGGGGGSAGKSKKAKKGKGKK